MHHSSGLVFHFVEHGYEAVRGHKSFPVQRCLTQLMSLLTRVAGSATAGGVFVARAVSSEVPGGV